MKNIKVLYGFLLGLQECLKIFPKDEFPNIYNITKDDDNLDDISFVNNFDDIIRGIFEDKIDHDNNNIIFQCIPYDYKNTYYGYSEYSQIEDGIFIGIIIAEFKTYPKCILHVPFIDENHKSIINEFTDKNIKFKNFHVQLYTFIDL